MSQKKSVACFLDEAFQKINVVSCTRQEAIDNISGISTSSLSLCAALKDGGDINKMQKFSLTNIDIHFSMMEHQRCLYQAVRESGEKVYLRHENDGDLEYPIYSLAKLLGSQIFESSCTSFGVKSSSIILRKDPVQPIFSNLIHSTHFLKASYNWNNAFMEGLRKFFLQCGNKKSFELDNSEPDQQKSIVKAIFKTCGVEETPADRITTAIFNTNTNTLPST